MIGNATPAGEFPTAYVHDPARLQAVRDTELLDTPPEESFDRLTRLAVKLLGVPIAFVSIVDEHRDFYKSFRGLREPHDSSREISGTTFCHYTIASEGPLVIEDTRAHPVYRRVPVVESLGVAAYMGVAIRLDGHAIGSFCVVDTKPRRWSELDVEILSELALSAQREIQLRRQAREAVLQKDELDRAASERAAILNQVTTGVIVANPGGEVTFVNGTAWKIYGLPPQEDLATFLDPLEFFTLEGAPVAREALPLFRAARQQETIGNAEFRVRCSNGREVITRGHAGPIYRQDGSLLGAVASFRDITAQREAELALHESEEKFRQITENIQDIFWIFTPDFSETVYISPRYETLMQRPAAEVYERPLAFLEPVLPEDQGTLLTALEKLRHEGVSGVEMRVRLPDGSIRWHCASAFPVRDVQGKVYRIVGISQDITEQKAAHEALRDRERYYRALIENASDLISIIREDGTMVYESPSAEQVVGWRPEEMLGRTMFELVHPEDLVRVQKDFQSALRNPHQRVMTSYRFRAGDGTWRQMESTGSNLLADPAVKGIVVHSRDVTARRESEARIRFQAQLLDTVGEGVIAVDLDGTVLFWNRFAEQLYGYSREEALGARLRELLPSDTGWNQTPQILQRLRAGEVWSGEFLVKRRDGSTFPTQVINSPIRDQSGQLVGIVGISSDLSERKQLEEQLRLSQRMEAIGRLAGGVAHDFNNILTVIKGECFMLLDGLSSMDPGRGGIEEIDRSADRAASLTRQLLAFSRKQVLRPQVIQPNRVVEGLEKMLHRLIGEDIELVTRLAPELDSVAVDPGQFEQVIMNLVVNARDAMPEGGVLIISTENRRVSESLQRSNYSIPAGRYIALSVQDTGHGIPDAILGQIYEPFFTTKAPGQGTGLGLSTVYGIVKQSGGFIEIDSTVPLGVEFTILLPASEESARPEPAVRQRTSRDPHERKTVLLVEDETAVRTMLTRVLERAGFAVLSADGPGAALKFADTQSSPIDILLTDVVLREIGGPVLAQMLQEKLPGLRTVFMSGYTDEAIARRGVLQEGAPLLEKPFTSDLLLQTLKQVLS